MIKKITVIERNYFLLPTFAQAMQKPVQYITISYLLLLVLIKMLALPFLCLQFDLNRAEIASRYCENKDKPQMKCGGKCQLKKQLRATEGMSNSASQHGNSFSFNVDFFEESPALDLSITKVRLLLIDNHPVSPTGNGFKATIFHPPGSY
jgi:hypothetical protein